MTGSEQNEAGGTPTPPASTASAAREMYEGWRKLVAAVIDRWKDVGVDINGTSYKVIYTMTDIEFFAEVIGEYYTASTNSIVDITLAEVINLVDQKVIPPVETCQRMRRKIVAELPTKGADAIPPATDGVELFII